MATAPRRTGRSCFEEALRLLGMGLWPVPIYPPGPKARWIGDPGKQPIGRGWGATRPTEASLAKSFGRNPDASVGLLLGHEGGVIDLEWDGGTSDPDAIDDALRRLLGGELVTMGWESSRGPHLLLRYDDRLARYGKTVLQGEAFGLPGLELRIGAYPGSTGAQLQSVVPPSPTSLWLPDKSGTEAGPLREWNGVEEIAAVPGVMLEWLDRNLLAPDPAPRPRASKPRASTSTGRRTDAELAEEALGHLPPAGMHYGDWIRVGMALSQLGEEGLDLWDRWSRADERYADRADLERHWKTFRNGDGGVRLGTLFDRCKAEGWTPSRAAKEAKEAKKAPLNGAPTAAQPTSFASFASFAAEEADEPVNARAWPESPGPALWHGPAADFTLAAAPYTEADPVGVLASVLVMAGSMMGRAPHWTVGATRHHLNLFACTTGPTSSGRKGTAKDLATWAARRIDPEWSGRCVKAGLSSGEGLIWAVRDPIHKREPVRENKRIVDYEEVMTDPGVEDKRLLVVETEFGGTLQVLKREGNSLSSILRQAWDDGYLRTLTKNNPAVATDAHISILAHVTEEEVGRYLSSTDAANGFGNRILWLSVRRSKYLPTGGTVPEAVMEEVLGPLGRGIEYGRALATPIGRDREAEELWDHLYRTELDISKPGLLGAVLGRSEAQTMRLAALWAVLDQSALVRAVHLRAALELWRYAVRSASYIFGDQMGDPDAERVLSALKSRPEGMSQTDISIDVFQKHKPRTQIARILGRLLEAGSIYSETVPTGGRPALVWHYGAAKEAKEAKKAPRLHVPDEPPVGVPARRLVDSIDFVRGYLSEGPQAFADLMEAASRHRHSESSIREAGALVGVAITDRDGKEFWSLEGATP